MGGSQNWSSSVQAPIVDCSHARQNTSDRQTDRSSKCFELPMLRVSVCCVSQTLCASDRARSAYVSKRLHIVLQFLDHTLTEVQQGYCGFLEDIGET